MPASRNTRFRRILQLTLVALLLIGALSQAYRFVPGAPREASSPKSIPAVVAGNAALSSFAAKEQTQKASPAAIEGWAVDAETGQSIVGATARMGDFASTTDSQGHFVF